MRCKAVLSIIAFLAAFGISVALTPRPAKSTFTPYVKTGCAESENARKITNLLEQDIANGRVRDRKLDGYDDLEVNRTSRFTIFASAIDGYTDASENIDDADLPGDFKMAWRRHMKAWRTHSDFLNEFKDVPRKRSGRDTGEGGGFSRKQYAEQNKEISDTWAEVLRIARKYDAYIPAGAY